jgi:hypothetical protein
VKIGYLCAWCFRLYCINAGIPLPAVLRHGEAPGSPARPFRRSVAPPELRVAGAAFAVLRFSPLLVSEPIVRLAEPSAGDSNAHFNLRLISQARSRSLSGTPFQAASSPQILRAGWELQLESFDLNGRLRAGKPVALIFWQPGVRVSEEGW